MVNFVMLLKLVREIINFDLIRIRQIGYTIQLGSSDYINTMNITIVNSIVIQCLFKQLGYWNKYAINMHSSEYSHR